MPVRFPRFHKNDSYSRQDFNRVLGTVEKLDNLTVAPPLELIHLPTGPLLRLAECIFWAQITEQGSKNPTNYAYQEVDPDGAGGWIVRDGGHLGTLDTNQAYERNNTPTNVGTIVRMYPGVAGEYIFENCCAGQLSSGSSSSSSSSSSSQSSSSQSSSSQSSSSQSSQSVSSQSSAPCGCSGVQPLSVSYTTSRTYTLTAASPCYYTDNNGHDLTIQDNGPTVTVRLIDGTDEYSATFPKPFDCCLPRTLNNIICDSGSCPATLTVFPFCCNNVSPYPCANCFNGKAPGNFYFSYMGQSYTVQAFSACQWGNVNQGPLPTVQIQQQPTPPPPLPPYFYTITLITPDGNEFVQSIYQSTPLIDCCQDFYLRWVYGPNPGNPNVPSIVQLTSYDCGCSSSSSSSQSVSSQSQSSQPSQGSCCNCAYTIQSYLSWGLDGHGNRADLDLYVLNGNTGQVSYFGDLNPPGSNLTHSCDGCPECDIDVCCPNPAFELVSSIAPFTVPCVFEAWYSQYSDCASVVYPTTAQFQINNIGTCIITVNGSPVLPGRTMVVQPIADAGYNTGAMNNFSGGTVIDIRCLYNCSSSSSGVSSSSVSQSSVSSKQSSSSLVSCSSGNCTGLTVVTDIWCDPSCNGTLYWTTTTVCVPSCIQVSQTFPGNNGLTAQVVTSIVDCPDNVGPEFTVAFLTFPDCTKVGDGQPDCQQGTPLTVLWNYEVINYCDIQANQYTICLPSGTCIY